MPRARAFVSCGTVCWLALTSANAQDKAAVPTFPAKTDVVTVDVVVLDKAGHTVSDLSKSDFTLFEDGRPQVIVGFESRALAAAAEDTAAASEPVASNGEDRRRAGRNITFLIDDFGIEPLHMPDVRKAIGRWLDEGADPRDEVTVATTSGNVWWTDSVASGRADLQAVLQRAKGKKDLSSGIEAMTEWEAYRIDATPASMLPEGRGTCIVPPPAPTIHDRVTNRWFRSGACVCLTDLSVNMCRELVLARAREGYARSRARALGVLDTVERLSRAFASSRGRKSIVILSESLLRETDPSAYDRVVDASRRGNTSISFVDVRGLMVLPFSGAEMSAPVPPEELLVVSQERRFAETNGGEYLADTTGGSMMRDTNDLAGAVRKVADEASAYYLLGYETDRPPDAGWRKLKVQVSRPGLVVRARRGYFASAEPPAVTPNARKDKRTEQARSGLPARPVDPALWAGSDIDDISLRLVPYVMETNAAGTARVLVVAEVDTSRLAFSGTGKNRKAELDVAVLGAVRDGDARVWLDSSVELSLGEATRDGWWLARRELHLPPGPALVRVLVRDRVSGRSGLVSQRVEIPPAGAPYVSTPILSDRLARDGGLGARIAPVAHHRFAAGSILYCSFEVFVAPGREELPFVPDVRAGYSLLDDGGRVVASMPPTPIAVDLGGRLVRTWAIATKGLTPGRYDFAIRAGDEAHGIDVRDTQAFVIEGPGPAPGPGAGPSAP